MSLTPYARTSVFDYTAITRANGSGLRIIVSGLVAQRPRLGRIVWHYLQYILGLLQHIYHSILCIGALVAHRENSGRWIVSALDIGACSVGCG
jgi:hypothetical protein